MIKEIANNIANMVINHIIEDIADNRNNDEIANNKTNILTSTKF